MENWLIRKKTLFINKEFISYVSSSKLVVRVKYVEIIYLQVYTFFPSNAVKMDNYDFVFYNRIQMMLTMQTSRWVIMKLNIIRGFENWFMLLDYNYNYCNSLGCLLGSDFLFRLQRTLYLSSLEYKYIRICVFVSTICYSCTMNNWIVKRVYYI